MTNSKNSKTQQNCNISSDECDEVSGGRESIAPFQFFSVPAVFRHVHQIPPLVQTRKLVLLHSTLQETKKDNKQHFMLKMSEKHLIKYKDFAMIFQKLLVFWRTWFPWINSCVWATIQIKKGINLCLSLTFWPTCVLQRVLVCTLFSCSMSSTMNQDTKAGHSVTVWLALTRQSLGKAGLSRLSPLNSLPSNKLFHCLSGAILGETADFLLRSPAQGKVQLHTYPQNSIFRPVNSFNWSGVPQTPIW